MENGYQDQTAAHNTISCRVLDMKMYALLREEDEIWNQHTKEEKDTVEHILKDMMKNIKN